MQVGVVAKGATEEGNTYMADAAQWDDVSLPLISSTKLFFSVTSAVETIIINQKPSILSPCV